MLASVITDEVATILNDMEAGHQHERWPVPELLNYLTEAISAVVTGKPSLFVVMVELPLAPGSTQQLSSQYSQLLDMFYNLNSDGSEGADVLPGVHSLQQAFNKPTCVSVNDGVVMSFGSYEGSDMFYWVDPPVPNNLSYTPKVKALVQLAPQPITAANQPILFPGTAAQLYQSALVDWVLYRCYSKDQESATSFERSQSHLKAFQQYLGMSIGGAAQAKKTTAVKAQPRAAA